MPAVAAERLEVLTRRRAPILGMADDHRELVMREQGRIFEVGVGRDLKSTPLRRHPVDEWHFPETVHAEAVLVVVRAIERDRCRTVGRAGWIRRFPAVCVVSLVGIRRLDDDNRRRRAGGRALYDEDDVLWPDGGRKACVVIAA